MSNTVAPVYVVDDDVSVREAVGNLIRSAGLSVETFASAQEFLASPRVKVPSCLVLDVQLPGLSGLDLQQELVKTEVQVPIIFLSGHGDIPTTVRAMKAGALEFLTKPIDDEVLLGAIHQAIARQARAGGLQRGTIADKSGTDKPGRAHATFLDTIVGRHGGLRAALSQVEIVAPTNATVLISGETGTGKELIARAIHELSPRHNRNLVKVNCAAIPGGLLESELFGHERGAFTGALMQKKGRFELGDGGSLFLDEIGDIPLELQPKLLRAVQEQEFERLGSANTIRVNVRMIAATHRDLPVLIREGKFREDLFYRLNVFPIAIPPLRERRGDIPVLANYFVSKLSREMGRQIRTIPAHTMEMLTNRPWKGNVRELANFIERAVVLSQGDELQVPTREFRAPDSTDAAQMSTFNQAERNVIIDALKAASGRIAGRGGAAERLGLKRTTLQNKMHKLGIAGACSSGRKAVSPQESWLHVLNGG